MNDVQEILDDFVLARVWLTSCCLSLTLGLLLSKSLVCSEEGARLGEIGKQVRMLCNKVYEPTAKDEEERKGRTSDVILVGFPRWGRNPGLAGAGMWETPP